MTQLQQEPKYVKQIKKITNGTLYFYAEGEFNIKTQNKLLTDSVLDIASEAKIGIFIFDPAKAESVKFNIEAEDADYILKKTELCMAQEINNSVKRSDKPVSAAYTTRFKGGSFAGKTPAEILLADPSQKDALINQYHYLEKQTNPKFAAMNKNLMMAIMEAVQLFQNGQLKSDMLSSSEIMLYSEIKTPHVQKVDERGLTLVRQMQLSYLPGEAAPYKAVILNCMAPPIKDAMVGARMSEAADKKMYQMCFTEKQWFNFWNACAERLDDFEQLISGQYFQYYQQYRNTWKN